MSKELLFKKGYHLEVTSWENDGDNVKTTTKFCGEDEETAKTLLRFCKEFWESYHSGNKIGVGNMMDDEIDEAGSKAQSYLKNNPEVLTALNKYYDRVIDVEDQDFVYDVVIADFNGELFGNSEYYIARVFDKGRVIYAPEDAFIEVLITSGRG
jgi:hypothetical protein